MYRCVIYARMMWISSSSEVITDENSLSTKTIDGFFDFLGRFSFIEETSGLL